MTASQSLSLFPHFSGCLWLSPHFLNATDGNYRGESGRFLFTGTLPKVMTNVHN